MKNLTTFSTLFFIRKKRPLKNGEIPICLRITTNGVSQEMFIKRSVRVELWDQQRERVTGNDHIAFEINAYMDTLRTRILQIQREMEADGEFVSAITIKEKLTGKGPIPKMLLEVMRELEFLT